MFYLISSKSTYSPSSLSKSFPSSYGGISFVGISIEGIFLWLTGTGGISGPLGRAVALHASFESEYHADDSGQDEESDEQDNQYDEKYKA